MNVKLLTQSGAFDLVEVKKHLKIQIIIIILEVHQLYPTVLQYSNMLLQQPIRSVQPLPAVPIDLPGLLHFIP